MLCFRLARAAKKRRQNAAEKQTAQMSQPYAPAGPQPVRIQYVGRYSLDHIADPAFRTAVRGYCDNATAQDSRIAKAEIRNPQPHQAHDLPHEREEVIEVDFRDQYDNRIGSASIKRNGQSYWKS